MNIYYRDACKKLHCLHFNGTDVAKAHVTVMEYLHNEREVFIKPILAVIEGGKREMD